MITLVMKSLMEVSLFMWSHVFKNPELKPMIDARFEKFKVNIYLNNFFLFIILIWFVF
jgi:hypothetical protein